ncbi:MAG: hypothetical protein FWH29_04075 [Methanobrevibacter sp.]|nr:hypothetical protein [Methanobrevibacter sp.]
MNRWQFSLDKNNFLNNSNEDNNPSSKKSIDLLTEEDIKDSFDNKIHCGYEVIRDNEFKSKDYSLGSNQDGFNKNNIDFKDLKDKLNNTVYNNPVLTDNAIRHIKKTIGSNYEILWETGNRSRIIRRKDGEKSFVYLSKALTSRADRGRITTQMIHNHTSGIPLPHPEDMVNLLKYKVHNSGIIGSMDI